MLVLPTSSMWTGLGVSETVGGGITIYALNLSGELYKMTGTLSLLQD